MHCKLLNNGSRAIEKEAIKGVKLIKIPNIHM
jgi:hypothetical protein